MTPLIPSSIVRRRDGQLESLMRLREKAGSLLDAETRLKDNQAHLDAEAIQLAEGWQKLRRAQEAVDAREKAVAARELAQSGREGVALRALANERLERGRALLLGTPMPAPAEADDRSLDAARAQIAADIVRCGAIARGEIATDELPPGTAGDDDLTAQRRVTAAAIIQAGKQRRAEV